MPTRMSTARNWSKSISGVLTPPWYDEDNEPEVFGYTIEETRAFAMKALERRLKVIGLAPATA